MALASTLSKAFVPNSLNNYQEEVLRLTAGCSVVMTGEVVESPGKGQKFELQVTDVEVIGFS